MIERIEDSLVSFDRKDYHFKLVRKDEADFIQEVSTLLQETPLGTDLGLKFKGLEDQKVRVQLEGK